MPELPEVETVRKGLEAYLKNFAINKLEVLTERSIASEGGSQTFAEKMQGVIVGKWFRRGKYLIATLYKDNKQHHSGWWVIHLRMTGYFQWFDKAHPPCSHTRVRFWNKAGSEIRFIDMRNFGQMWWIPSASSPEQKINGIMKLGPEPFSEELNPQYLEESLKNRKRPIKSSLLDQSILAGVGNIYADETLFQAGINPKKESKELTLIELEKLCKSLRKILKISIGKGGTTFSDFRDLQGLNGNYGGEAWVYKRDKQPCRKCGVKIKRMKLSGRGTHWCPNCQK